MNDIILIVICLFVLSLTIITFSKENTDYISISVIGAITCVALVMFLREPLDSSDSSPFDVLGTIDIKAMIFVFSMQFVVTVIDQENVFQYVTVKMIRWTKGNQRKFFYVTCILGTLMTALVGDVIVALIFVPLIIKTCRILEIPSGTYTLGLTISIITGLVMTPFASGENIIVASAFDLDVGFFAVYLLPLALGLMFLTVVLLDHFTLRKEEKVAEERKLLLLDLLDASVVIGDHWKFYIASIGFIALFVCLFAFPANIIPPFVFALVIGAILVMITGKKMTNIFKHIQWDVIFFYICLFLIIGCLVELGLMNMIADGISLIIQGNIVVASILVLLLACVVTTPLLNSPVILMFIPIVKDLAAGGLPLYPLVVAMIIGVILGGLMPQGSTCEVLALDISKKFNVPNLSYKRMLKVGAAFGGINIAVCLVFVTILSCFFL
ncbi:MAG: Na+/H+ antiporter NhaD-like permease [Promethearchaeota archaeon CR_4]|nr:MAG: Na+/H+ antiporter NhaD-like permease [Candidatus Lokiarchaeota archaeon CR_4]